MYYDTLWEAIGELDTGPKVRGSKARDEIMPGLRTVHIARHGRQGRHLLLYRIRETHIIEIVRILHDQMEVKSSSAISIGRG
jgi:toxin ParE1/3/4